MLSNEVLYIGFLTPFSKMEVKRWVLQVHVMVWKTGIVSVVLERFREPSSVPRFAPFQGKPLEWTILFNAWSHV